MQSIIPITVVSGYLGSGKTTLIKHILKCKESKRIGIIVNDFAEINVDEQTLLKDPFFTAQDQIISLKDGSISGRLREQLVEAVYKMAASQEVDVILIESTGIGQPDKIAKALSKGETDKGQQLSEVARLDTNVTIVDGFRLLQQFSPENGQFDEDYTESNLLIINQIEFCDVLIFNKTDLLEEKEKTELIRLVKEIQPNAAFYETQFSQVTIQSVIHTKRFDEKQTIKQFDQVNRYEKNSENELGIESFVYRRREPFHPEKFDQWLDNWPRTVTRCKGVVWFVTQPQNVIKLSQSGRAMDIIPSGYWIAQLEQWEINKMFEQRTHLKDIWDENYGDRMIELVFIGKGMNREKIIAELDQCLVARGEAVQVLRDPFLIEEA